VKFCIEHGEETYTRLASESLYEYRCISSLHAVVSYLYEKWRLSFNT
jgi:hypothetical protein